MFKWFWLNILIIIQRAMSINLTSKIYSIWPPTQTEPYKYISDSPNCAKGIHKDDNCDYPRTTVFSRKKSTFEINNGIQKLDFTQKAFIIFISVVLSFLLLRRYKIIRLFCIHIKTYDNCIYYFVLIDT